MWYDERNRTVHDGDRVVVLTRMESQLIRRLVAARGNVVPHANLRVALWQIDDLYAESNLKVLVLYIRRKLGKDAIETRLNHGYRWTGELEPPLEVRKELYSLSK